MGWALLCLDKSYWGSLLLNSFSLLNTYASNKCLYVEKVLPGFTVWLGKEPTVFFVTLHPDSAWHCFADKYNIITCINCTESLWKLFWKGIKIALIAQKGFRAVNNIQLYINTGSKHKLQAQISTRLQSMTFSDIKCAKPEWLTAITLYLQCVCTLSVSRDRCTPYK